MTTKFAFCAFLLSFRSEAEESAVACFGILLTMPAREYDFFVYIAASRSHQLYIGFTNGLRRRMREHRERTSTYTARYHIDRLVYYEHHQYVLNAIAREKELKTWSRVRKIALIKSINPTWADLSLRWEESERQPQIPSG